MLRRVTLPVVYGAAESVAEPRPRTRGDCKDGLRPCPWVGCRHHLYLDVLPHGHLHALDCEPHEMRDSCSLDVADEGEHSPEDIGLILSCTRQRVQQNEADAKERIAAAVRENPSLLASIQELLAS